MKTAIIGSRSINISKDKLLKYIPHDTTEIVSGGAKGVDRSAKELANDKNIKLTEFLPQYDLYKKGAPLIRNIKIIEYCDRVIALWDDISTGTKFVIDKCKELNKPINIHLIDI